MKKLLGLGLLLALSGALSPARAEANARGWFALRCVEESTGKVIGVWLENRGPQRSSHFFQGQARVAAGSATYFGSFTKNLIDDRTRLAGYFDLAIRASGRNGFQVTASLIQRPFDGIGGGTAFGHIEIFEPGTRNFQQYLVSCAVGARP
ncbi:MAG TPA: hypothetical protein VM598_08370 [Bdellovibrionota bacterium]|nr:hypothetical protein [Bdellovibrionota bacterium]